MLWTPGLLEEHRDNAAELEEVATALEDPVSRFWAACDRILVSMWGADLPAADRGLRTIAALAERVGQPILRWIALWYGSWRAHLAGRLDEAEALAFQAAEVGTASGQPDAQAFLAGQLVPLRWDQGRMEELVPLLAGALEANPGLPIFRAWLALAHCECDRPEEAERLLSISADERFEDVRDDIIWTATMTLYAEVAARIGAREPAAVLYDALCPYADQLVFNATTTLGSIARYAGQLAAALGRYDDAERHFAHAATTHAELEAPGFLARTRCDWALALLERGGPRDAERAQRMLDDATAAAREIGAHRDRAARGRGHGGGAMKRRVAVLGGGAAGVTAAFELTATAGAARAVRGHALHARLAPGRQGRERAQPSRTASASRSTGCTSGSASTTTRSRSCRPPTASSTARAARRWPPGRTRSSPATRSCCARSTRAAGSCATSTRRRTRSRPAIRASGTWSRGSSTGCAACGTTRGDEHPPGHHLPEAHTLAKAASLLESAAEHALARLLEGFRDWLWDDVVSERVDHDGLRFVYYCADFLAAVARGVVDDDVGKQGFGATNDEEWRAWLGKHGASQLTLDHAPFIRGYYDLAFAYEDGDKSKPNLAAGKATQDLIRIACTYKGAMLWKMQAGMGDTVFGPLYEVLANRGVNLKFFHHATHLTVDPDTKLLERIEIQPQVELEPQWDPYQPLYDVNGLPCWPSEPQWEQIKRGKELAALKLNLELEDPPPRSCPSASNSCAASTSTTRCSRCRSAR